MRIQQTPLTDYSSGRKRPQITKYGCRSYRTVQIQAGPHVITAADPLPDKLRQAIEAINGTADLRTALPNSGYMKLASIPPVKLKC
jgi:hypothetical protein